MKKEERRVLPDLKKLISAIGFPGASAKVADEALSFII
jgi:hypothetical protein